MNKEMYHEIHKATAHLKVSELENDALGDNAVSKRRLRELLDAKVSRDEIKEIIKDNSKSEKKSDEEKISSVNT